MLVTPGRGSSAQFKKIDLTQLSQVPGQKLSERLRAEPVTSGSRYLPLGFDSLANGVDPDFYLQGNLSAQDPGALCCCDQPVQGLHESSQ